MTSVAAAFAAQPQIVAEQGIELFGGDGGGQLRGRGDVAAGFLGFAAQTVDQEPFIQGGRILREGGHDTVAATKGLFEGIQAQLQEAVIAGELAPREGFFGAGAQTEQGEQRQGN